MGNGKYGNYCIDKGGHSEAYGVSQHICGLGLRVWGLAASHVEGRWGR